MDQFVTQVCASTDPTPPKVVFLIGSGASAAEGMPRLNNLVKELSDDISLVPEEIQPDARQRILAALEKLPDIVGSRQDAEDVLVELTRKIYSGEAHPQVFHNLRMGIWWFFLRRQETALSRRAMDRVPSPYREFAAKVRKIQGKLGDEKSCLLIVNLNWDELLEEALEEGSDGTRLRWKLENREEMGDVSLVKPHGSLRLIARLEERNGRWDDRVVFPAPCRASQVHGYGYCWNTEMPGPRPLMVLPGIAKSSNHWYLWNARRRLHKALMRCTVVVVIGIGLCQTDEDIIRLVEHAMWHRLETGNQLDAAHVVDFRPEQSRTRAIQGLQEALRPSRLVPETKGFDAWVRTDWQIKLLDDLR